MATSINSYSVRLSMDAAGFVDATKLSRSEAKQLIKDIESARTPAENFAMEQDRLAEALRKGAIQLDVHQRLHDQLRDKYGMTHRSVLDVAGSLTGPLTVGFGAVAAAAAGALATGTAFVSHLKETQNQIDDVADSATKLGLSYNELTGLRFAAQEGGGVDAATVDASMKKLQINIANALEDSGSPVNAAFKALGTSAGELLKAGPVEAVKLLADGMQGVNNQSDRLKLSMEVFGKSGTELVSTLEGGRDAIEEAVGFHNTLNGLTDAQVLAVSASNDAWDRVGVAIDGITAKLSAEFAPAFLLTAESLLEIVGGSEDLDSNMQTVVNSTAYYTGQLKDIAEIFASMPKAVMGMNISDALDVSSGQKAMEAVIKKRQEMEASAFELAEKRKKEREKLLSEERIANESASQEKLIERLSKEIDDAASGRIAKEEKQRKDMQDRLARNALKDAEDKFKKEEERANKLREQIAKGPGDGAEIGSADAVRFMAEQINKSLAGESVSATAKPSDEQLLEETKRQYDLMKEESRKSDEQIALLKKLVDKPDIGRIR